MHRTVFRRMHCLELRLAHRWISCVATLARSVPERPAQTEGAPAVGNELVTTTPVLLDTSPVVTGVEKYPTARLGLGRLLARRASWLVLICATAASIAITGAARPAGADALGSLDAQAASISAQLAADSARLGMENERYDQAELHFTQISSELAATSAQVARDVSTVGADDVALRDQAITAYTTGGTSTGLDTLFEPPSLRSSVAREYLKVSSGNIQQSVANLTIAQVRLRSAQAQLESMKSQASAALAAARAARQAGQQAYASDSALMAQLKGRIGALVAARQAATETAARAALTGSTPSALPPLPPAQGAQRAIAAAESQIGVPYVWGGATPGVGFDCSGLTMWAWGQAGVSLSHSAEAQYGEVAHVPLSALEPGDLLFWASGGYIYHVGMYIGNGDMVDAPQTGQTVQIQPVFYSGLYGAGRP